MQFSIVWNQERIYKWKKVKQTIYVNRKLGFSQLNLSVSITENETLGAIYDYECNFIFGILEVSFHQFNKDMFVTSCTINAIANWNHMYAVEKHFFYFIHLVSLSQNIIYLWLWTTKPKIYNCRIETLTYKIK